MRDKWYRLGLISVYVLLLSCLMRIIARIDPQGVYYIMGHGISRVFHWLNLCFLNTAGTLCVTLWADALIGVKKMKLNNMKVTKIITTVVALVGCFAILICTGYGFIFQELRFSTLALNAITAILALFLTVILVYSIIILSSSLSTVTDSSKHKKLVRVW